MAGMQYNIVINQKAVIDNNLDMDIIDASIMDFLWDYQNWIKVEKIEGGWFWAANTEIIRQNPLLGIKTSGGLAKKIDKLVLLGLIERHEDNKAMRKSFYRITDKYKMLFRIASSHESKHSIPADEVTSSQRSKDYYTNNHNTNITNSPSAQTGIAIVTSIFGYWNEQEAKRSHKNPSVKYGKAILSTCRKLTPTVEALIRKAIKDYGSEEEIKHGIDQYVHEILNREDNGGTYYKHRFAIQAFFKQKNGLETFINKDEKITHKQCNEPTSPSTTGEEIPQSRFRQKLQERIELNRLIKKDTESTQA